MNISVIIVTYNRLNDLENCLKSVFNQTERIKEIIIIDNARNEKTKEKIISKENYFNKKNIEIKYIENKIENSLTVGRNLGIKESKGDLIALLDDDFILDKDYYKEILNIFNKEKNAIGVQGYNQLGISNFEKIHKIFFRKIIHLFETTFQVSSFFEKDKCRVLSSLCVTYPFPNLSKAVNCQWISGGAGVFKRNVFKEIFPDNNLKKYCWNEDVDFSYRIFKRYPKTLFLNPNAKYWHKESEEGRMPNKEVIYMGEVYDLYLFIKNIDQNFTNRVIYLYSRAGRLFYNLLKTFLKNGFKFKIFFYYIHAFFYAITNYQKIKKGNLEFFNKKLKY